MFDIGLFGWMGFVSFVLTNNLNPVYPFFWFIMQIGIIRFLYKISRKLVAGSAMIEPQFLNSEERYFYRFFIALSHFVVLF